MGWLRKTFKKIGKGIKKAFMKFGKFMGKIGVLGQVAMMFILPGIGAALMKGVTGAFGAIVGQTATQATAAAAGAAASTTAVAGATAAGASASAAAAAGAAASAGAIASTTASIAAGTFSGTMASATGMMAGNSLVAGAGHVLQFAGKVASMPGKVFSSVTQGVTKTLGEFSKTALNKISPKLATRMGVEGASSTFFAGSESAFAKGADAFAAPFSKQAAARVTERTAAKAFAKEGLTYDADTLMRAAEKTNISADNLIKSSGLPTPSADTQKFLDTPPTTTNISVDPASITNEVGTLGEYNPQTGGFEYKGQTLEADALVSSNTPASLQSSLDTSVVPGQAKESLLAQPGTAEKSATLGDVRDQFVEDVMDVGANAFTEARETVTGKLSNLADPAKVIPALAKTAVGSYQDAQYAARANEREPEVIDLGQSQDFRDFQASDQGFFQNSAIGPYQVQNANTYTPQSSWAQQQMLMLQQQQQQGVYS